MTIQIVEATTIGGEVIRTQITTKNPNFKAMETFKLVVIEVAEVEVTKISRIDLAPSLRTLTTISGINNPCSVTTKLLPRLKRMRM